LFSTASSVIKALRRNWATNIILLLIIALVVWVAIGDLSRTEEKEEGEQADTVSKVAITASEIGKGDWKVGPVEVTHNTEVYEVTIVGKAEEPLFRFNVDALQARPLGKGEKQLEGISQLTPESLSPLPLEMVRDSVSALLPQLETGVAVRRGRGPFFRVPIMYGDLKIAEVRVDAVTKQVIPVGEKPPRTEEKEREKGKTVPKNLVLPLGYLSALVAILSTLYYSWKRSLYGPIRAVAGEAKAMAITGLRRTLTLHMRAGVIALGLAALHVLNFTQKLHLTISWLTLAMMATVVASGAFGKYFAKTEVIRHYWRRFHVPYTVLFFLVLLLHVLMKVHPR
jgi:hypothetical protein